MINNECMKQLILSILIVFISASNALAVPDTIQKGEPTFVYYDVSSDIALRNKLEANYDKKYMTCDDNSCVYNAPLRAYEKEVAIPFALQKKYIDYDKLRKEHLKQNN